MSDKSSNAHDNYRIALYYCYVDIENVSCHVSFQHEICGDFLKGRIRVSSEGLNGVLSGLRCHLEDYQRRVEQQIGVTLDVKYCLLRADLPTESQLFDSLSIKATREVVSLYEPTAQEIQNNIHQKSIANEGSSNYYRRRKRNRQKPKRDEEQQQCSGLPNSPLDDRLVSLSPSPHLSPHEWNQRLAEDDSAILLDARNCYESCVGYFQVEGAPTLFANTRKYSSLPQVLTARKKELAGKTIYMYCTGGVRCERASVLLQALDWEGNSPKGVYQLDGGIQRYLEHYGSTSSQESPNDECLFRGKNFVFDPRRTDPVIGKDVVGRCLLCHVSHDDYDNGKAPCQENEVRCCKCRVLVLVCDECRQNVNAWGQGEKDGKPSLYCGIDQCRDTGN